MRLHPVKTLTRILDFKLSLSNLLLASSFFTMLILLASGLWQFVVENQDGWILGDWLVNYEDGGFKRRGLSGSFFLLLNDITHVNPAILVFSAQMILYGLLFVLLFLLLRRRQLLWSLLILLFNPITLLFYVGDPNSVGRKDVVIIIILLLFALTRRFHSTLRTLVFAALIAIATLLHELAFFFVPYFLAMECVSGNLNKDQLKHFLILLLAGLVPLLAIAAAGASVNNGLTESILASRGVTGHVMGGVFSWGVESTALRVLSGGDKPSNYSYYILYFALGLIPFLYYLRHVNLGAKKFLALLLITFSFSLPLFALGVDWGRWLNIHFTMILILFIYITPPRDVEFTKRITVKRLILSVLLLLYVLIWSVPHCNGGWRIGLIRKVEPLVTYFIRLIF